LLQEGQLGVLWKQIRAYFKVKEHGREMLAQSREIEEARK